MSDIAPGHAAARALERYGIHLTIADLRQIMLDIMAAVDGDGRSAVLQRRLSDGAEHWYVLTHGQRVRVAYDPSQARIMSVLLLADDFAPWRANRQKIEGRGRRERARWGDGE